MVAGKKFAKIQCPICRKEFKSKMGLTLKQWNIGLYEHLTVSSKHTLPREEAESVIAKYFQLLEM
jgi:hypothetical protein